MKLATEFVKLPLLFDVERLQHEVAQFAEDEWLGHTTGYAGNLAIPLVSLHGEFNDAVHGPMRPTAALARCEYIQQIMAGFNEVFGRSRLMRLDGSHDVPPHVDVNYHWFNHVRIHIPVTTTPDVLFYCGKQHVHMAAGECWIFDTWSEHTVKNQGANTRVHLVLDITGSARFWNLVEQGEWPFFDAPREAAEPKFIAYEPGRKSRVRTESFNAPLVQSPGELAFLVRGLTDDIACRNDDEERKKQDVVKVTTDFLRQWREVWSEHGMKPGGWPAYHRLVQTAEKTVSAIARDMTLKSGANVAHAFGGLVLSAAINEEYASQYLDKDEVPPQLQQTARAYTPPQAADAVDPKPAVGRNDPCPCGSGERYKHCHGRV